MPIKLDWIDHNVGAESRKVYRSLTKIDQGNLGTPLVTLPGTALTYTDTTVQRGVTYHYVVTSVVGTDEAPSAEFIIAYIPYTGPGPQTLIRGTWDYGYFGRVAMEDIFSQQELFNACGLPSSGTINNAANYWHKVVHKGKILFFANNHLASALSFANIYNAGCVYGNRPSAEWPAAIKTQLGTVEQNKIVSSSIHKFYVRLPTSRGVMSSTSTASIDLRGGEYDGALAGMYLNREFNVDALPQMDDSFSTVVSSQYFLSADYHSGSAASTAVVCRTGQVALGNIDSVQAGAALLTGNASGSVVWRPVLELVT
jgi:hypothetical protein